MEPPEASAQIEPGGATATLTFEVDVPITAPPGRHVLTADIWLGDEPRGDLAEMLLEVLPG